jgi:hypothetical protein
VQATCNSPFPSVYGLKVAQEVENSTVHNIIMKAEWRKIFFTIIYIDRFLCIAELVNIDILAEKNHS